MYQVLCVLQMVNMKILFLKHIYNISSNIFKSKEAFRIFLLLFLSKVQQLKNRLNLHCEWNALAWARPFPPLYDSSTWFSSMDVSYSKTLVYEIKSSSFFKHFHSHWKAVTSSESKTNKLIEVSRLCDLVRHFVLQNERIFNSVNVIRAMFLDTFIPIAMHCHVKPQNKPLNKFSWTCCQVQWSFRSPKGRIQKLVKTAIATLQLPIFILKWNHTEFIHCDQNLSTNWISLKMWFSKMVFSYPKTI